MSPQQATTVPTAESPPPVKYEGPPLPFEDEGACPFEGCIYREWTTTAKVAVLRERRQGASVAFELPRGARVTALMGVVVTVVPGIVQLDQSTDVSTGEGPVHLDAGEVFYLLTYQGEGYSKAWIKGRVHTDIEVANYRPKRLPSAIWWVQIRNSRGQVGWTQHPEAFDGKDSLG